jgi:hypothetical protein
LRHTSVRKTPLESNSSGFTGTLKRPSPDSVLSVSVTGVGCLDCSMPFAARGSNSDRDRLRLPWATSAAARLFTNLAGDVKCFKEARNNHICSGILERGRRLLVGIKSVRLEVVIPAHNNVRYVIPVGPGYLRASRNRQHHRSEGEVSMVTAFVAGNFARALAPYIPQSAAGPAFVRKRPPPSNP